MSLEIKELTLRTIIGALVAAVFYAPIMIMMSMLVFIGGMMGFSAPLDFMVGMMFHFMVAIIHAVIFAVILKYVLESRIDVTNYTKMGLYGLAFGLGAFILGPVMMMPIMAGMFGATAPTMDLVQMMIVLVGHLVYGAIIAIVVSYLYKK